ncbi:hypothetical protein BO82DRAFT_41043 [Aspergillus uvarum CBS 121591]|uniref:Uncharacterized protein n=1 Tax=Aspergillus uvarum CBS 121591 TaxID=1448315 RepID=A0A319CE16_9EURO|nr:hypothetical protein BO82DRAFT_41043 [Aspergillus uvarum CBS 121591]PYH83444.1 hypothetical protein BO82DRAFT_41043 [Aspergillus uvarum CBS 121591]
MSQNFQCMNSHIPGLMKTTRIYHLKNVHHINGKKSVLKDEGGLNGRCDMTSAKRIIVSRPSSRPVECWLGGNSIMIMTPESILRSGVRSMAEHSRIILSRSTPPLKRLPPSWQFCLKGNLSKDASMEGKETFLKVVAGYLVCVSRDCTAYRERHFIGWRD